MQSIALLDKRKSPVLFTVESGCSRLVQVLWPAERTGQTVGKYVCVCVCVCVCVYVFTKTCRLEIQEAKKERKGLREGWV